MNTDTFAAVNHKTKIVVLEGAELNPGDLSWEGLYALGDVTVFDQTISAQFVERAAGAEVVVVNKLIVDEDVLSQLPSLKYIAVSATGYNSVDIEAARKHAVLVSNIPVYSTESVAQMVFAHLLNITSQVAKHNNLVQAGEWQRRGAFSFTEGTNFEICGLTMGIIGFGHIGQAVARIALGFGLRVMAYTSKAENQLPPGVSKASSVEDVFRANQILTLHCPLTEKTKHIINSAHLALMPKGSILINTGRGGLVDDQALAKALTTGHLYAAGIDVLSTEPPAEDHPLLRVANCYITPHNAWATQQARQRLLDILMENIKSYTYDNPQNIVN